jgi:hypothetical protein
MPKALEQKLKRQVAGKDWSEERKDAYVYGTLRKTGWTPSHQKMQAGKTNVGLALYRARMQQRRSKK